MPGTALDNAKWDREQDGAPTILALTKSSGVTSGIL